MTEPPEKPATKPMPLSEWLTLMLSEIERKKAESKVAGDERQRRETDARRGKDPDVS